MALKLVLFYNQFQRGFSETWFLPGSSPPIGISNIADAFYKKAIAFRAAGTVLTGARYSVVDSRVSATFRFGDTYTAINTGGVTNAPEDVVSTTAVWTFYDSTNHIKHMFLRGLQDRDVTRDPDTGADIPSTALLNGVRQMFTAGQSLGLQLRWQSTPSNTPGFKTYNVTQVNLQPPNVNLSLLTLDSDPTPDIIKGNKFVISGVRKNDCPGIPKVSTAILIVVPAPFGIVFTYRFRNQAPVFPTAAIVMKQAWNYTNIIGQQFIEFSERKTGRPFFQPRGRASVALRRL